MSTLAIVLKSKAIKAQAIMKLHRSLWVPMQILKTACSENRPIVEIELFEGDYPSHAELIRAVLRIIHEEVLVADYFEIPHGEKYAGSANVEVWRIDFDTVNGILDSADEEFERQLGGI